MLTAMTQTTQISLVADEPDAETSELGTPLGLWSTAVLLVHSSIKQVEQAWKGEKKEFAEQASENTAALNKELDDGAPKGKALAEWGARVCSYRAKAVKIEADKKANNDKRKELLAELRGAEAELHDTNPAAQQLTIPFSTSKPGSTKPSWTDGTIGIVNGLARQRVHETNGNPGEGVRLLVAALADYHANDIALPTKPTSEADEGEEGEDLSSEVEESEEPAEEPDQTAGEESDEGDDITF